MHVPDRPGIYKLFSRKANGDLKLLYIGRATSIRERVTTHNKPLWDECTFEVVTDETIRKMMEKHLISEFAPPYNKLEYGNPFDSGREEQALWTFLEEDRFLSLNELADELGETPVVLENVVDRLCEEGLLETKDADGKTLYNISGAIEFEDDVVNVVDDSRFTLQEEEILSVFCDHGGFLSYQELAEELGRPDQIKAVRSRVSELSKTVEFEKRRDGKYVQYKLSEKMQKQLGAAVQGGPDSD
jgi:biotin operon repressor